MSHKKMLDILLAEWDKHPGFSFGKFLIDAFQGEGIVGIYTIADDVLVRVVKEYYKKDHKPVEGRTTYFQQNP